VIARIWRGATSAEDADAYVDYLQATGLKEYRATRGNEAAALLRRALEGRTEFLALTFWASLDAIRGFAGDDIGAAVFYPEDDRYLVERDHTVSHYEARDMAGPRTVPVEAGEISRVWHGWTSRENAGAYETLLEAEVLPGIHDRIEGFRGVYLLHRDVDAGVEFATITRWSSLEAIRAFAGDDYEAAVVPPEARALLDRFDERSSHYETIPARG
jgi:heme-degrading monooxygenase HmoA